MYKVVVLTVTLIKGVKVWYANNGIKVDDWELIGIWGE